MVSPLTATVNRQMTKPRENTGTPTPTDAGTRITILRQERLFIVGTTNSGKSSLADYLLREANHIVVLDPKHGYQPERKKGDQPGRIPVITDDYRVVVKHEGPEPLVYQPPTLTPESVESQLRWFWDWVWWREQTIVYVDELTMVIPSAQRLPYGLARLIQQGRQKGIGTWCATQRPSRIPIPVLSESEHHCVFRLRHPADLRRMAEYTDPIIESDPAMGHDFWYYYDAKQVLFKTNLNELKRKG